MKLMHFYILLSTIVLLVIYSVYSEYSPPTKWSQVEVTNVEKQVWLNILPSLEGIPYKLGGQSPQSGFDCSGLIVYLYNQIGIKWFKYENSLVRDVSADALYNYNVSYIDFEDLKPGDFIFFDTDIDGKIDHVSIFDRIDENGNIWVWDATTDPDGIIINAVSHRIIKNFWLKKPLFGKPLKIQTN